MFRLILLTCFSLLLKTGFTQTIYTFNGNGNWSDSANWLNSQPPPEVLKSGSEIIINPATDGTCTLNISQIIAAGAKFTIVPGKKINITGSLAQRDSTDAAGLFSLITDTTEKFTGGDTASVAVLLTIPVVEEVDTVLFRPAAKANTQLSEMPSPVIEMPVPGHQGRFNSCVGWAVGYAALSYYQKQAENNGNYTGFDKKFSPSFIWNGINGGNDIETTIPNALNLLLEKGCCKYIDMAPEFSLPHFQPLDIAKQNAANYKIAAYKRFLDVDIAKLKRWVNRRNPIVFLCTVDEDFKNCSPASMLKKAGNMVWVNKSGKKNKRHAMVICGYDDQLNAFKVMNSWGTGWGDQGFIWIDYGLFEQVVYKYPQTGFAELYMIYPRKPSATARLNSVADVAGKTAVATVDIFETGSPITESGVCYSTEMYPTTASTFTKNITVQNGDGSFNPSPVILVRDLLPATRYYIRAYAKTTEGIIYSDQIYFTTKTANDGLPTVMTIPVTSVTSHSAETGGVIIDEGSSPIVNKGLIISRYPNEAINFNYAIEKGDGIAAFDHTFEWLTQEKNFYVKAFAINDAGIAYGEELKFKTGKAVGEAVLTDFTFDGRDLIYKVKMSKEFYYQYACFAKFAYNGQAETEERISVSFEFPEDPADPYVYSTSYKYLGFTPSTVTLNIYITDNVAPAILVGTQTISISP
ncbi:MAG: C1 family peptidase [Ferruginibacter sp.]